MFRRRCTTAAVLVALTSAFTLAARDAHAGNEATAEALFLEAKKLVAERRYAEACPKFAESNRLDRGAGTLIHLADCYEKNGQTASAWATYAEASSLAQAQGRKEWQTLAKKRGAALEPTLARIELRVESPVAGLEVTRDGERVAEASFGLALPVDPGPHAFTARAAGHETFERTVTLRASEHVTVQIPRLVPAPVVQAPAAAPDSPKTPAPAPEPAASDEGSGRRTLGVVVGGIGVAGLAVGAITGLMALGANNDAKTACPDPNACNDPSAQDSANSARSYALVSTIGVAAGAGLVAIGGILFFTAPRDARTTALRVGPWSAGRASGITLGGTF